MKNIILALSFILFNFLYLPNTYADDLLEVENRVIKIYQETVPSVVNVANIKYADSFFLWTS